MIVVSRAEPTNQLVETLKSYFGGEERESAAAADEVRIQVGDPGYTDPYVSLLQSASGKFTALRMMGISWVTLSLEVGAEGIRYYRFDTLTGSVEPLVPGSTDHADVKIQAASPEQLIKAVQTNDMSLIEVTHSLI